MTQKVDLTARVREVQAEQFKRYDVRIRFASPLHGGLPATGDLIASWIEARVKKGLLGRAESERIKSEYAEETVAKAASAEQQPVDAAMEEHVEKSLRVFRADQEGIYIETRQIKAMFKECSQVAGLINSARGSRQLWQHGAAVTAASATSPTGTGSDKLRLERHGIVQTDADGVHEAVVHAMTPQGPRHSIKRSEYVADGAELAFTLWVLDHGSADRAITDDYVARALGVAEQNGLGADRSQGFGRFVVVSLEATPHDAPTFLRKTKAKSGAE